MAGAGNQFSVAARRLIGALPFLWLALFFLLPFAIVLKISFADAVIAVPPYTDLLARTAAGFELQATLDNYHFLFRDELYALAFLNSLKIAAVSTLICLLIGYPLAWGVARAEARTRNLLLLLIVLPSWTSFLIRVYAWMGILGANGYLNQLLLATGLIDSPLAMLRTDFAVYIGIVYTSLSDWATRSRRSRASWATGWMRASATNALIMSGSKNETLMVPVSTWSTVTLQGKNLPTSGSMVRAW